MTRKKRKQARKRQPFLSDKEAHKLAWLLVKALNILPKEVKFCNQTFITEKKERGCFPFGGYHKDICLCKHCYAKDFCAKKKDQHIIKSKEWEVCNNEKAN